MAYGTPINPSGVLNVESMIALVVEEIREFLGSYQNLWMANDDTLVAAAVDPFVVRACPKAGRT